jgi:5-methylcytosine-specific restriction endonuclease McrA
VYESKRNQLIDKTRWNKVSHAHREREPQCVRCGSTERLQVDHIIEVADNGSLYDPSNLQTLCADCHDAKTKGEDRKRRAL